MTILKIGCSFFLGQQAAILVKKPPFAVGNPHSKSIV